MVSQTMDEIPNDLYYSVDRLHAAGFYPLADRISELDTLIDFCKNHFEYKHGQ